jgi:hypothetical protein
MGAMPIQAACAQARPTRDRFWCVAHANYHGCTTIPVNSKITPSISRSFGRSEPGELRDQVAWREGYRDWPPKITQKPDRLGYVNPAWIAWLMGFPPEWIKCAPSETLSSRKSRRRS